MPFHISYTHPFLCLLISTPTSFSLFPYITFLSCISTFHTRTCFCLYIFNDRDFLPFSFLPVSLYFNYHVFLPIYKSPLCLYFTNLLFLPPFFSPVSVLIIYLSRLPTFLFPTCISVYFNYRVFLPISVYHLPIMPPYLSPTLPTFFLPTCFCLKYPCHAFLPISV